MNKSILDFFEKTVETYPEKNAFVDVTGKSSFREAYQISASIGSFLAKSGTKRAVAVLMEKSTRCITAMLGVLFANDYYIVLDVNSPAERIARILKNFKEPLIITDFQHLELAKGFGVPYAVYEEIVGTQIDSTALEVIRREMCDLDTAYILFTSGSTGIPKGTVISHRALISYIEWVTEQFRFDSTTVFGSQTPLYFSMSVTDLYSTLKCGCTYAIIPKINFSFPVNLVSYLNEHRINTIYWVPTAISILANWKVFDVVQPKYLKTVLFAGEVMPTKQLNYWRNHLDPQITYANLFGPTETTDICTYYVLDRVLSDGESIPIGKACNNCNVFVLTEDGVPVRQGEEGELYVRTSFMADGYYNDPEKTGLAFVQNPLNSHFPDRVYRTGDIVRENEHGELLYVSRKDFQIKRMGYRIELGEIEASAFRAENVRNCACVFDQSEDALVLIYEGEAEKDTVINVMKATVPAYMLPDRVIKISAIPQNANGKIDRNYLKQNYKQLKE